MDLCGGLMFQKPYRVLFHANKEFGFGFHLVGGDCVEEHGSDLQC
jgi:hypothetical protein